MPKQSAKRNKVSPCTFQTAIDAVDVIGTWDWDIPNNRVKADLLVSMLFGVDPEVAEAGAPLELYTAGMHPDDRERIEAIILQSAREGGFYIAEYRVRSADGVTRWVLARGKFLRDEMGRPMRGHGIIIDITKSHDDTDAYAARPIFATAPLLDQAAEFGIATREAVQKLNNPHLTMLADALLFEIGRHIARHDKDTRNSWMN